MTVSTMMHGEYGIDDVCLSTLNLIGNNCVRGKVNVSLTDEEVLNKYAKIEKVQVNCSL